ncbi:MAG: ubiquinone/menaquinone biosynthesis methyltransferase [Actinomycetota bacterium]
MTDRRAPSEGRVASMFDRIVPRYDFVNSLLSLGLDSAWRRRAARSVAVRPRDRVLDLGCGTGRLAELLAGRAAVTGLDVSEGMLTAARERLGGRVALVRGSAFKLPFVDAAFRAAVSGFVLRNLDGLPAAFAELARVIEPGGSVALVDITGPSTPFLRPPFDAYFGTVAPLLGRLVGEADAYRYLARSLSQLPDPPELCRLLETAGFEGCRTEPLTGGMVTLWTAKRA